MKTSELAGVALDYAVAVCEGGTGFQYDTVATYWITINGKDRALSKSWAQSYTPSTNWAHGGPIIERAKLTISWETNDTGNINDGIWVANIFTPPHGTLCCEGSTPLIAAMRCFVASKLGDEVEVPRALWTHQH